MTNIFSTIQMNQFAKKFLSWFVVLSMIFQVLGLTTIASAHNDDHHMVKICHSSHSSLDDEETLEVEHDSNDDEEHMRHGDMRGDCPPPPIDAPRPLSIIATKIVCDDEAKLPNWGMGGPNITANTATEYVATHPGCSSTPDWKFQWGYGPKANYEGVQNVAGDFVGEVNGSMGLGSASTAGYNEWKTFGPTTPNGVAQIEISDLAGSSLIWVREVLKDGYIPFTFDSAHQSNANNKSAEMYCATDALNYDNFDYIGQPELGKTYYCVAWNALKTSIPPPPLPQCSDGLDNDQDGKIDYSPDFGCDSLTDNDENDKPVITVVTPNPTVILLGSIFADLGANATDAEDCIGLTQSACNTVLALTATGTVNTAVLGTSTITYTAVDSKGVAADPKTRTVVVQPVPTPTPVCTLDVVSDETNRTETGAFAVATYALNPRWTATIPGATWIWKTFLVSNPLIDQTTTFTKDFVVSGTVSTATVLVSADNSFSFSVNGTPVGADNTEFNYFAANQHSYNVTTNVHAGTNTLLFVVKNWQLAGSNAQSNPAGLLYKLHIGYIGNCVPPPTNTKPVITVVTPNPTTLTVGGVFTDLGATALDLEDGNITSHIVATGTVNMSVVGIYTITYNVSDSLGLAADQKTRTVLVQSAPTKCSDGIDNDHDGKIDFPLDLGCDSLLDNDENNKPIITVVAPNPTVLLLGSVFVDLGANATDTEDCIGLTQSACNLSLHLTATGTVNTAVLGTSTITYTAVDSKGIAADPKTRTVVVMAVPTKCSDGLDNDQDGKIDFPLDLGCDSVIDNDENNKPIITVVAPNPTFVLLGSVFADLGANATDTEDCIGLTQSACNSALTLTATGTVNTLVLGTSTITYSAVDSKGLVATPKTRTVVVMALPPKCSDGLDNDQDGKIDFPLDLGCDSVIDNDENNKPTITVVAPNPTVILLGSVFVDLGANATDTEDCIGLTQSACNSALTLTATGTVNTAVLGTYTITYNATDTQNLAADAVTRTVNVTSPGCTVNCGGGGTDNLRPTITLTGSSPIDVIVGTTFTDPGATATDPEDGNLTPNIVVTGGPVTTGALGTFTLSYNVSDSKGLPALEVRRDVRIVPAPTTGCVTNCGGGGGPISLTIFNERIASTGTSTVTVTWNTNQPANSRVVYGLDKVPALGTAPSYGYPLTTATDATLTTSHSMVISGIPGGIATNFRPVSFDGLRTVVGVELTHAPLVAVSAECFYLREYMRLGQNNNPVEVTKLQMFLRNYEGFSDLSVTGFFDTSTDKAVRVFQDRYKTDVLDFWNLPGNTGYVYFTTQKKINELYCKREFPLDGVQMNEIIAFRDLINRSNTLNAAGGIGPVLPLVGINLPLDANGSIAGAAIVRGGELASGAATINVETPARSETTRRLGLGELLAAPANLSDLANEDTTKTPSQLEIASVADSLPQKRSFPLSSFFSSVLNFIFGIFK